MSVAVRRIGLGLLGICLFSATSALAQEPGIEFELGGGLAVKPRYEGSKDYLFSPYPTIRFQRLTLPNGFQIGGGDGMGLNFSPAFNLQGERSASDNPELAGLPDVDRAVELGVGVSYTQPGYRFFAEIRKGVTGHDGVVGEFGGDMILRPNEALELSAGPRFSFANNEYMDTYFSVSPSASLASGFSTYDAGAGFKSSGVEAGARYEFMPDTALEASARYDRLVGDAADSPVVAAGSKNQFSARIGLVRHFTLDF